MPVLLFSFGVCLAVCTCVCILGHLECDAPWIPKSPWFLVALCLLIAGVTVAGVVTRVVHVNETVAIAEQQLSRVDGTIKRAVVIGQELADMTASFQTAIDALPSSCSKIVPGAEMMMTKLAQTGSEKCIKMGQKVAAFNKIAALADKYVELAKANFDTFKAMLLWVPLVPLFCMLICCLAIGGATVISWCSSNPKLAEMSDAVVLRFGAPVTCCITVLAVSVASGFLLNGIMAGSMCVTLDQNVVDFVHAVNFTDLSHFKYNINPLFSGAAKYYILGSQENPLISMLEDVERDALSFYSVYNHSDWAVGPLATICSGMNNLHPHTAMTKGVESCVFAKELLSASNIYPYYDKLAHQMVCGSLVRSSFSLIIFTVIIAFVLLPMLAIFADVDLRKWAQYKEENFHDHYGTSEPRHDEQQVPLFQRGHQQGIQMQQSPNNRWGH